MKTIDSERLLLGLTRVQMDTLLEIATGATSLEIARRMFVSEDTIKSRLRVLLRLTGTKTRIELVAHCYELGILSPSEQLVAPGLAHKLAKDNHVLRRRNQVLEMRARVDKSNRLRDAAEIRARQQDIEQQNALIFELHKKIAELENQIAQGR